MIIELKDNKRTLKSLEIGEFFHFGSEPELYLLVDIFNMVGTDKRMALCLNYSVIKKYDWNEEVTVVNCKIVEI